MGSVRPARRLDALRAFSSRGLPSRPKSDGGPPYAFALLQRSIAAPPHRPADPKAGSSDDASSPGLRCRTTRARTADPRFRRASGPAACRVRGFVTPIAASTTVPPDAFRRRSVHRLHPSRPSPRVDRSPSRSSLPSWRCSRRFASPPGGRADAIDFRASIPARIRSGSRVPKDAVRRCLLGVHPPERSPPAAWARLWFAGPPLARIRWRVVTYHRRHRVLRHAGVGWPVSGLPALVGLLTFRPSRRRSDRRAGRAHGFASRLASSCTTRTDPCPVAYGPAGAEAPTRRRRPSVRRLSTSSKRQSR